MTGMCEQEDLKKLEKSNSIKGITFSLCAQIIWGFSVILTKQITADFSPLTLLSWRFTTGMVAMTLLIAMKIFPIHLKGKNIKPLVLLAVFQPILYFIGETVGIKFTTASESGIFIAMIPIVTLILSIYFLKTVPSKLQIGGVVISVAGIVLMVACKGVGVSFSMIGYSALVLAVFSAAIFSILSDKAAEYSSIEKTYIMAVMGALAFDLAAAAEHIADGTVRIWLTLPVHNLQFMLTTLYLGIGCSVISFCCMNASIKYIGATRTTTFASVTTVLTVLCGVFILGENLNMLQGAGIILVIAGIYMANKISVDAKDVE
ncbi:DMT family transporter [Aminipila luticellarii]|uniref:DMT family transporter n=1 Tax=Aminipila luticellarii TaxID=2507160 RepID=A0A410PXS3_9FIRM|nr:DMT family transporter [Aminipila luticellarii]